MKKIKRLTAAVFAVMLAGAVSVTALAADTSFGSAAVEPDETYTLAQMLTYAIQDEYLAYAEYDKIIDAYGAQRPFINIIKAEETHISALEPLFTEYGVTLPENTAADYAAVPATLAEAYQAGVDAEISNIAMYETFLKQDLPDDVKAVFTALKNASESHLAAFERGVARSDGTLGTGTGAQGRQLRGRTR